MLAIFLIVVSMSFCVSALVIKNKNGKMILRGKVGETIDKTIGVVNENNITVKVELTPTGGLKDSITILDNNFTLEPDEEFDARFQIKVNKEGEQNGTVVVKFLPANIEDGKNGIALGSTIILIGEKGNGTSSGTGCISETTQACTVGMCAGTQTCTNEIWGTCKKTNPTCGTVINNFKFTPLTIGLIATAVIFVIFIALLFAYFKKNQRQDNEVINKGIEKRADEIKPSKRAKKNE